MADIVDDANELTERFNRQAIFNARLQTAGPALPRTGRCHNCGELIKEFFCDADCRDDWEKRKRMRGR